MPENDGYNVWKWISGILSAVLVTGIISWFSFGIGTVSKRDYAEENRALKALVQENTRQITTLTVQVATTNERLQSLIERLDREHPALKVR